MPESSRSSIAEHELGHHREPSAVESARSTRGQYVATWRDEHGAIVRTTDPSAMCWAPRKAGYMRATREGIAIPLRCRDCPGCYELERRELEQRLQKLYADNPGQEFFRVAIYAPLDQHSDISNKLHRRPRLQLEPGYFRLGVDRFCVIARGRAPIETALNEMGLRAEFRRIRKPGRRRPWRCISIGLLVSREHYGEQTKRWYARGLPKVEKQNWTIERTSYEKYDWRSSPRAWTDNLILVPPEVWKEANRDRRKLRALMRTPRTPEMAEAVAGAVRMLADKLQSPVSSAPPGALSREAVLVHYEMMRAKKVDAARAASANRPPSQGGRHASSLHSDSTEKRTLVSDEDLARAGPSGQPRWMERERQDSENRRTAEAEKREKIVAETLARIERMRQKARARAGNES